MKSIPPRSKKGAVAEQTGTSPVATVDGSVDEEWKLVADAQLRLLQIWARAVAEQFQRPATG